MKHTVSALKKAIVLAVAVTLTSAGAAFAVTKHVSGAPGTTKPTSLPAWDGLASGIRQGIMQSA